MYYNTFHLISETSPTGEKCHFSYDYAGRKKTCHLEGALKQNHRTTTYSYNSIGQLAKEECHGIIKEFAYDVLGRLVSESTKNSSNTQFTFISYGHDIDGNCSEVTSSIM